jgi:hypothetical protein
MYVPTVELPVPVDIYPAKEQDSVLFTPTGRAPTGDKTHFAIMLPALLAQLDLPFQSTVAITTRILDCKEQIALVAVTRS